MRMEDANFDQLEEQEQAREQALLNDLYETPKVVGLHKGEQHAKHENDEAIASELNAAPVVRTLNGDIVDDELVQDAQNFQILLGKIDTLLDELRLDA